MNTCLDCGAPTMGVRCRKDNGRFIALQAARDMAVEDAELLASGITGDRLATRLNITREAAFRRLRRARERQALLLSAER